MQNLLDTFVKCPHCRLLVWQKAMPEMVGAMIVGNHRPVKCTGVAEPANGPVCPGSELFGKVEQSTLF